MDRRDLDRWVRDYERAWRARGTDAAAELFAEGATYRTAPFEPPFHGRDAIARMWDAGRDPGEAFEMDSEVVAVEGDTGVVRVEVRYLAPRSQTFRDLWVVRLDDHGRCVAFEEWPFWPSGTRGGFHPGPA